MIAATIQRLHKSFPKREVPVAMAGNGAFSVTDSVDVPIEAEEPEDIHEALKPARGLILGLLFSVPVWSAIGFLTWFLLGR